MILLGFLTVRMWGENVARPFTMFRIERCLTRVKGDAESTRLLELFIVVLHQPIDYFVCSFGPVHRYFDTIQR